LDFAKVLFLHAIGVVSFVMGFTEAERRPIRLRARRANWSIGSFIGFAISRDQRRWRVGRHRLEPPYAAFLIEPVLQKLVAQLRHLALQLALNSARSLSRSSAKTWPTVSIAILSVWSSDRLIRPAI
jgi:hypothetical protein